MASNTENLKLLKKNPTTDGADTFNVQTMLNDNWDKIDRFAGSSDEKFAGLLHDDTKTELLLPPTATPDDAFKLLAGILGITYVLASAGTTVTAQSGNDTKTAVAASDGIATFKGLPYGEWTFSATISGVVRSKKAVIDTQRVQYLSLLPLNYLSWAKIDSLGAAGVLGKMFALGDTKDVELSGIGTMTLQIADFDHDYLSGATTAKRAAVTFLCKNLLYKTYQMNGSGTNNGGFPASALCSTLNGSIYNALPPGLKSVIKTAYKWYGTGNNETNGEWSGYKLWLPLDFEMFGMSSLSPTTEHTTGNARQYPIFTDRASRIKKMNNGGGSENWYWLASPTANGATHFCYVDGRGFCHYSAASGGGGVCFGLCV